MDTAAVIPVRMGSTRYPGKPLCDIQGMSMVEHVLRRTVPASNVDATYIATPDEEIRQAAESFGAEVIMTGEHDRATDRVAEAARTFEADVVVVMQGDEPLIHPEMIEQAVQPVIDGEARVTNLAKPMLQQEQYTDPNNVKLVVNRDSEALYFSRAPIPNLHTGSYEETRVLQQVCVIPFERSLLFEFAGMKQTPLERAESIDMLRLLENGFDVTIIETDRQTFPIDTPADREQVDAIMQDDAYFLSYGDAP